MNQTLYFVSVICISLLMNSVQCTKIEEKPFELSSSRTFPGFPDLIGPTAYCLMEMFLGNGNIDGSCAEIGEDDKNGNKEILSDDLSLYSIFEYLLNYVVNNVIVDNTIIPFIN